MLSSFSQAVTKQAIATIEENQAQAVLDEARKEYSNSEKNFKAFPAIREQKERKLKAAQKTYEASKQELSEHHRTQSDIVQTIPSTMKSLGVRHVAPTPDHVTSVSRQEYNDLRLRLDKKDETIQELQKQLRSVCGDMTRMQERMGSTEATTKHIGKDLHTAIDITEKLQRLTKTHTSYLDGNAGPLSERLKKQEDAIRLLDDRVTRVTKVHQEELNGKASSSKIEEMEMSIKQLRLVVDQATARVDERLSTLDDLGLQETKERLEQCLEEVEESKQDQGQRDQLLAASFDEQIARLKLAMDSKAERTSFDEQIAKLKQAMESKAERTSIDALNAHLEQWDEARLNLAVDVRKLHEAQQNSASPFARPSTSNSEKDFAKIKEEVDQVKAKSEVLGIATRSLETRFSQLTTDEMCRKMIHQMERMYPAAADMQRVANDLKAESQRLGAFVMTQSNTLKNELRNEIAQLRENIRHAVDTAYQTRNGISEAKVTTDRIEADLGALANSDKQAHENIDSLTTRVGVQELAHTALRREIAQIRDQLRNRPAVNGNQEAASSLGAQQTVELKARIAALETDLKTLDEACNKWAWINPQKMKQNVDGMQKQWAELDRSVKSSVLTSGEQVIERLTRMGDELTAINRRLAQHDEMLSNHVLVHSLIQEEMDKERARLSRDPRPGVDWDGRFERTKALAREKKNELGGRGDLLMDVPGNEWSIRGAARGRERSGTGVGDGTFD